MRREKRDENTGKPWKTLFLSPLLALRASLSLFFSTAIHFEVFPEHLQVVWSQSTDVKGLQMYVKVFVFF